MVMEAFKRPCITCVVQCWCVEMVCTQIGDYNDGEGVHYTNLAGFQSIALGMFHKDNPLRKRALLPLSIMPSHVVKGGFLWS